MTVCALDVLTSQSTLPLTYESMGFQDKVASSIDLNRCGFDVCRINDDIRVAGASGSD
jgi:hypothetical protein